MVSAARHSWPDCLFGCLEASTDQNIPSSPPNSSRGSARPSARHIPAKTVGKGGKLLPTYGPRWRCRMAAKLLPAPRGTKSDRYHLCHFETQLSGGKKNSIIVQWFSSISVHDSLLTMTPPTLVRDSLSRSDVINPQMMSWPEVKFYYWDARALLRSRPLCVQCNLLRGKG